MEVHAVGHVEELRHGGGLNVVMGFPFTVGIGQDLGGCAALLSGQGLAGGDLLLQEHAHADLGGLHAAGGLGAGVRIGRQGGGNQPDQQDHGDHARYKGRIVLSHFSFAVPHDEFSFTISYFPQSETGLPAPDPWR